eukprot:gene17226-23741_t
MSGHRHDSNAGTQNQGNHIGDRSSVRQSKLYRTHESGNNVKSILGQSNLCWNTEQTEGAYYGQKVYDHQKDNTPSVYYEMNNTNDSRMNGNSRGKGSNRGGGYGNGEYSSQQTAVVTTSRKNAHFPQSHPLNRQLSNNNNDNNNNGYRNTNKYDDYENNQPAMNNPLNGYSDRSIPTNPRRETRDYDENNDYSSRSGSKGGGGMGGKGPNDYEEDETASKYERFKSSIPSLRKDSGDYSVGANSSF